MWVAGANAGLGRPRAELALLLLASTLVVLALGIAVSYGPALAPPEWRAALVLVLSAAAGGTLLAAAMSVVSTLRREGRAYRPRDEVAELRRNLLTAEAIIKAEPQVLVLWEQGQRVRVVVHTLAGIPGLPVHHTDVLKFGAWLDAASTPALKEGLDALFADGRPFSQLLKSAAGGYVEADGRATGGRAILRLREVTGRKRDLSRILDQYRLLARSTQSGRALLDALPMPVWFRRDDGRIEWVNEAYVRAVEAGGEAGR